APKWKQACRGADGYVPLLVCLAVSLGPGGSGRSAADLFQEYLFLQCRCTGEADRAKLLKEVGRLCLETHWKTGKRECDYKAADSLQSRLKAAGFLVAHGPSIR